MLNNQPNGLGRKSASLLASCFVLFGGLFVCAFLILVSGRDPLEPLLTSGGLLLGMFLLLWLLRDKPQNPSAEKNAPWFLPRKKPPQKTYRLKRLKPKQPRKYGTNKPPTAETVRELSDGLNNWTLKGRPIKQKEDQR